MKNKENIKVCLVGSSGGHLTHLYMLKPFWKNKDHFWVTFDKEDARSLLEGEKMYPCYYPTNRSLKALIKNTKIAWNVLHQKILIPERDMEFLPYQGWSAANPAQSLTFWNGFCKIKHSRYANIQMANQKNVLYALGALYLLEMKYLSKIATSNEPDVPNKKSELFELDNWTYHYTPMGEMFACIEGEVCQLDDEN